MEGQDVVGASSWASLNRDVLERIGCELSLRELLYARLVCRQWRQHVAGAVRHLPHPHQHQQRHLVELDAQPSGREDVWQQALAALATCLPHLSEIMVYVSSRVSESQLAAQLCSLPGALTALTKLELRYIVPSSAPCLGTSLQQLQPALTALTALDTLYLIMGASPEPAEVTAVLPRLGALRDLKLLSGLPQYGFTNAKLEALGCATQLRRLHLEVSGVGQVDAGLAALSRLSALSSLWLDGLVTLGPAVVCALQQLPELQELRLELDSPQHIPDLFDLSGLKRLSLTYHGDELDEGDEAPPPDGAANNGGAAGIGGGVGGGSGTDWDALERMVRGHAVRPVLCELGLLCCSFPVDPLPRLALLTSLTSLTFYDCRWKAASRPAAAASAPAREEHQAPSPGCGGGGSAGAAATAPPRPGSWGVLTSLVGLQGFGMAQCVVPPICEFELASLAAAWPGITSLQLQSVAYRVSELLLLPLRPQPARFGAFLTRWRRLEALTLSGSWCNDPRVVLDVSLLPPSLTSLVVSSVTLVNSAAAKAAILENVDLEGMSRLAPTAGPSERRSEPHTGASSFGCTGREEEPRAAHTGDATGTADDADAPGDGAAPRQGAKQPCGGDLSERAADSSGPSCAHTSTRAPPSDCDFSQVPRPFSGGGSTRGSVGGHDCDRGAYRCCPGPSHAHIDNAAAPPAAAAAASPAQAPAPELLALEHLVLGEVRLGAGVSLELLARWVPNLRSLEVNNLVPNLTDDSCTALAALTALTVLRVSQDQDPEVAEPPRAAGPGLLAAAATGQPRGGGVGTGQQQQQRLRSLSGMGLTALTCLSCLRQLEWLPWGIEPLDLVHVEALASLRRLHLVTLRGARDGAITDRALEALRERLPLCDIDDTEWSGLVDV
ncbi:hypothetical protein PLESTB_000487400 [Pleodorina starrii]|uniref:F-box domain-containing protein n=1 Tax=Pleodorina starrii TaxID=330485 RepID=A0A9W6F043_9CHLO|nr:hypothetical protein PLESTM_000358600 [Pleodorina starrii]GLC51299.1 hypothetical protein PLESTB_000487400 [Pleodorina starrii]GLC63659.1 hypothetical protein PLESTF_000060300 [Pleodorina starrii]